MKRSNIFTQITSKMKLGAFIALAFFVLASSASAIGQLTEPIIIENAIRGYEFEEILTVINTDYLDQPVHFSTDGDIEGWATFFDPENPETDITSIVITSRTTKEITARIKVPEDTANGVYSGLISAEVKPADDAVSSDSSVNLSQSIGRQVNITVSDQEEIKVEVAVIPIDYNLPTGSPLDIKIIYYNIGNVIVKPEVGVRIYQVINDEDVVYHNVIYPYPEKLNGAKPLTEHVIPNITIPLSPEIRIGNVLADFTFKVNDEEVYTETIKFSTGLVKQLPSEMERKSINSTGLNPLYLLVAGLFAIMLLSVIGWIVIRKKGSKKAKAKIQPKKRTNGKASNKTAAKSKVKK